MKKIITLFFLISITLLLSSETEKKIISGIIRKELSPYFVSENLIVPKDSILIIKPGVSILFQGNYQIEINGKIFAIGAKKDSIYFGSIKDNGWNGINLYQKTKSDSSIFKYCVFFKADTHNPKYKTEKSALTISNYNFVKIENCSFYSNKANYGGAVSIFSSNVVFDKCKFYMNYGVFLGGAIVISAKSFVKIYNSIFERNTTDFYGGAIFIDKKSFMTVSNTLLDKNGAVNGGAISIKSASMALINCTITANNANFAGGLEISQRSDITIINSIIWGNIAAENDNLKINDNSLVELKYSITERDDIAERLDNFHTEKILYTNPKFNLTGKNPFSLADNSPAIDAGLVDIVKNLVPENDLAGNKRIVGKSIDIGAYEKNEKTLEKKTNYKLFFLRYNISDEKFEGIIKFKWNSEKPALIKIINDDADLIREIKIDKPKKGENTYIWDGLSLNNEQMNPGVYFFRVYKIK